MKQSAEPKQSFFTRVFNRSFRKNALSTKSVNKASTIKGAFGRQFIRNKVRKQLGYTPGSLGLSNVSEAIKKENGFILSRRDRKRLARLYNTQFVPFYNV